MGQHPRMSPLSVAVRTGVLGTKGAGVRSTLPLLFAFCEAPVIWYETLKRVRREGLDGGGRLAGGSWCANGRGAKIAA
jgi:hypothetical protein